MGGDLAWVVHGYTQERFGPLGREHLTGAIPALSAIVVDGGFMYGRSYKPAFIKGRNTLLN